MQVAAILGNDHEFSRELLANVQQSRGTDATATEIAMTLEEFKGLMLTSNVTLPNTTTKARRRHHDPLDHSPEPESTARAVVRV